MRPFACFYEALGSLLAPLSALFLLLIPMMGTIPPTDNNDGALFLPLTPMMGHYSSH
ncbi:unnamed protein product [Staurois parvus]|uniref:Uncharacterized protein n=1 Tax=Staurois parvus TaxID=386267 RepID=A0ABN9EHL3_9NEOB|nr:unnamed protein product [Staurois parvus]